MERKEIKKVAKKTLKRSYFRSILVIFIASIIISGTYTMNSSVNTTQQKSTSNTETTYNKNKSNYDVINETVKDASKKKSGKLNKKVEKLEKKSNGVLAPIVNNMTKNKTVLVGFINTYNLLVVKKSVSKGLISLVAAIISLLIFIFIRNIIIVGNNRFYLEDRKYKDTGIDKLLFPYKVRRTCHLASVLFVKFIYEFLWDLTIIGGIIKYYEYYMIPYVLAENPNIKRKEAFRLSKELMKGYKWYAFKLDISLIGWHILTVLTFGLSALFYSDAYFEHIKAELYMRLRKEKYDSLTDKKILNDKLLDINKEKEAKYPMDKFSIPIKEKKKSKDKEYDTKYTITTYIMFFFTFAFIGWFWEVLLHLITEGVFVNRGTMFGPWLPIYGFGGLLILLVLKPFKNKPVLFFIMAMVLAGILEYSTAWYLETFKGMKWWDYSGYFLNLHGRICLEGLLVFGLGGSVVTYFVGPQLNELYLKIAPKIRIIICSILVFFFGVDAIYSSQHPNTGNGVTKTVEAK
ncbi:MAG: DUF975 family protein [Bacilli bacterium]|nr:DUF975 family protein [Bacilli bacterium]